MSYMRSRPQDLLINLEEKKIQPVVQKLTPIKQYHFESRKTNVPVTIAKSEDNIWEEFQIWSKGKVSVSTYQFIIGSKQSSDLPDRISNIWSQWQNLKSACNQ